MCPCQQTRLTSIQNIKQSNWRCDLQVYYSTQLLLGLLPRFLSAYGDALILYFQFSGAQMSLRLALASEILLVGNSHCPRTFAGTGEICIRSFCNCGYFYVEYLSHLSPITWQPFVFGGTDTTPNSRDGSRLVETNQLSSYLSCHRYWFQDGQ